MSDRIQSVTFPLAVEPSEVIDVRSPSEFALDRVPGAINLPVLDDAERATVGTCYSQVSRFDARRVGAAIIARRVAGYLDTHFSSKPKDYHPLVYCWRGGQRSQGMATILAAVGWRTHLLDGGYKTYRSWVIKGLEALAPTFDFQIINGLTGSGKTLLLDHLSGQGGQVLDLEGLANHRGSMFGGDLHSPQPSQKAFESGIHECLSGFDPARPVFVEAESPKIGFLNIPSSVLGAIRTGKVTEIVVPLEKRAEFLAAGYADWQEAADRIHDVIDRLSPFHPKERIGDWHEAVDEKRWVDLSRSLLEFHYDKCYGTAGDGHYGVPGKSIEVTEHGELPDVATTLLS